MDVICEINSTDLYNILKSGSDHNIKHFVEMSESSYKIFDDVLNILINYGCEDLIKNIIEEISIGTISIYDKDEIMKYNIKNCLIVEAIDNNKFLVVE